MKLLPIAIASLCIAAHPTVSHASTVLFQENWSNVAVGGNAVSSGQWSMQVGQATQLTIVENPLPGLSGKWVGPANYLSTTDLPKLISNESFDMTTDGVRLSVNLALTDRTQANNYVRVGIQNSAITGYTNNYWFEVIGDYIRIGKGTSTGIVPNLKRYDFSSSEWEVNTSANIAFSITPNSSGNVELSLSINGNEVISYIDSTGTIPTFEEGFNIFLAERHPRIAYIGAVELQAIPEGSSYAMLLGGAGLLIGAKRFVGFSFKK